MVEISLTKSKFKENGEQIWRNWCKELLDYKDEALATLMKEGVKREAYFTDGKYLYILMIAESLSTAKESVEKDPHPIDLDHRRNVGAAIEIPT